MIEIPKGDNRRWHMKPDKSGFIDLGPIKDIIPVNEGIMPIHYGYIPETLNENEGDEIDILVLSDKALKVGQEIDVEPIALIRRADGDDKVVAVDENRKLVKGWDEVTQGEKELIEKFFSYHHRFLSIENHEVARKYIDDGNKQFMQARQ